MPIAAAGIIAAGTLGGALIGSSAAGHAADLQSQAAQNSLAFNNKVFDTNQQNFGDYKSKFNAAYGTSGNGSDSIFAPYMNTGASAAGTLSNIYGFNGSGGAAGSGPGGPSSGMNWDAYINTPDYQFTQQQGVRALDMSAASKHLLNSGGEARDVMNYGSGLASQQFGSTIQRLMAMMGQGSQAAGQFGQGVNSYGSNAAAFGGVNNGTGQNISANNQSMGNAQAAGVMGQANPFVNALNTGPGNALGAYSYFNNNAMSNPSQSSMSSYISPGVQNFNSGNPIY